MINEKKRFTEIFDNNLFNGKESISGEGSSMSQTDAIRKELPNLIKELSIRSMIDAPCGDWNWMRTVDLDGIDYLGVDIVDEVINNNINKYSKSNINFASYNIINHPLPKVDIILCRDCLVHLTYDNIFKTLNNFRDSGSTYLLTTTFPFYYIDNTELTNIWRPLNLEKPPFNLNTPIKYIEEWSKGVFGAKTLGLWKLDTLN